MPAADTNPSIEDELNTTAPQSSPTGWKMPDPVFRRTSGRLPRGFEKEYLISSTDEHETPSQLSRDTVEAYVEPKPNHPTMKVVVVALAVIAMVAFIIAFLSILYFFFLRSSE